MKEFSAKAIRAAIRAVPNVDIDEDEMRDAIVAFVLAEWPKNAIVVEFVENKKNIVWTGCVVNTTPEGLDFRRSCDANQRLSRRSKGKK